MKSVSYDVVVYNEFDMSMSKSFDTYAAARKAVKLAKKWEIWVVSLAGGVGKVIAKKGC